MREMTVGAREVSGAAARGILSPDALAFVAELADAFEDRRQDLLGARRQRRGREPHFLDETRDIRASEWRVASPPPDLVDRRVEITGPVDRKMIINALNSGANVFMADFEDSHAPTWQGTIDGQVNVRDAVRRTIEYVNPQGKRYTLNEKTATLVVRPRGWHLDEKHVQAGGRPVSASLFDFGLTFFHNRLPYYYLPKMESHLEARLWNDVFLLAQERMGLPRGTIRATVLIETAPAAFEMDEILWELREHSAGLNCGRWDYIFSFIKTYAERPGFVLPDRAQVTMDRPFLRAYVDLLIRTCHRRGIHAMGGMAAQIPIRDDPEANAAAMEKVRQDKLREVRAGHDGTWVAHPALVPIAREVFTTPNQLHVMRDDVHVTEADLRAVPEGDITEAGLRTNLRIGMQYLDAWLKGSGCVPLNNLMEDAATAEISRTQVWQWVRHDVMSRERVRACLREEAGGVSPAAARIFEELVFAENCPDWMTTRAYEEIP